MNSSSFSPLLRVGGVGGVGGVGAIGVIGGIGGVGGGVVFLTYRYHSMTDGIVLRFIDLQSSLFVTDSTSANTNVDPSYD